jgi:CubicO group peptidase (beta-lactamase class C family)
LLFLDPLVLLGEWETMLESLVLEPLRMRSTHAFDPASDPALLPKGYSRDKAVAMDHNRSWPAFIGPGGIVSTPDDMMLYLEYSLGLLDVPLTGLLSAPHTPSTKVTTSAGDRIALAWFLGTLPQSDIQVISKNGGVPGFDTQIDFAPSTSTGVFVLSNSDKIVDVRTTASQVLQIINGLTPAPAAPTGDQP